MTIQSLNRELVTEIVAGLNTQGKRGPLRSDLTEAEKAEALRIGRIEFKSAGAVRKR